MSIKTSYKLYNGPDTPVAFIFIFQPLNEDWNNSISSPFLQIHQWKMLFGGLVHQPLSVQLHILCNAVINVASSLNEPWFEVYKEYKFE